jgi:hypothetical protein
MASIISGDRPRVRNQRILSLVAAGVFLAERYFANVGEAKIIENALSDLAATGWSGEHREITTVACARWEGESYSNESIYDSEIAGVPIVLAVQHGLAAMTEAVTAIIGQRYAVLSVVALRLGYGRRPFASVALGHGSAAHQGEDCNRNGR